MRTNQTTWSGISKYLSLAILGTATACSTPGGIECTLEARSIMTITVTDSISGAQITQGLSGNVTEGNFTANMNVFGSQLVPDVYERAGTYNVTVNATGYKTWQKNGVVVTKDVCHVQTVQTTAKLVK